LVCFLNSFSLLICYLRPTPPRPVDQGRRVARRPRQGHRPGRSSAERPVHARQARIEAKSPVRPGPSRARKVTLPRSRRERRDLYGGGPGPSRPGPPSKLGGIPDARASDRRPARGESFPRSKGVAPSRVSRCRGSALAAEAIPQRGGRAIRPGGRVTPEPEPGRRGPGRGSGPRLGNGLDGRQAQGEGRAQRRLPQFLAARGAGPASRPRAATSQAGRALEAAKQPEQALEAYAQASSKYPVPNPRRFRPPWPAPELGSSRTKAPRRRRSRPMTPVRSRITPLTSPRARQGPGLDGLAPELGLDLVDG